MAQNLNPPAYQEYAANMLSDFLFRKMTLQSRGLLYTMRLECWVNGKLPGTYRELAEVLRLPEAEVAHSLPAVMPFFEPVDGYIICPALEDYRAHLEEIRNKQSKGGKLGSAITNGRHKRAARSVDDKDSSTSRPRHRGGRDSLVQSSTEKPSQNQSTGGSDFNDPSIDKYYEDAEKQNGPDAD
jgi:hypothetical protein